MDIPAVDCVLFADPKQSVVDIVQAAGRAMRPSPGKRYGYIVVPIIVPSGMEFAEFAETTEFKQVARVITALSTQDDRIAEEFRGVEGEGPARARGSSRSRAMCRWRSTSISRVPRAGPAEALGAGRAGQLETV